MAPKGSKDQLESLKKIYAENSSSEFLVLNSLESNSSLIFLIGRDAITEYISKEFKISKKIPFLDAASLGIIDESGESTMRKRSVLK